jgi:hypothetical protein
MDRNDIANPKYITIPNEFHENPIISSLSDKAFRLFIYLASRCFRSGHKMELPALNAKGEFELTKTGKKKKNFLFTGFISIDPKFVVPVIDADSKRQVIELIEEVESHGLIKTYSNNDEHMTALEGASVRYLDEFYDHVEVRTEHVRSLYGIHTKHNLNKLNLTKLNLTKVKLSEDKENKEILPPKSSQDFFGEKSIDESEEVMSDEERASLFAETFKMIDECNVKDIPM